MRSYIEYFCIDLFISKMWYNLGAVSPGIVETVQSCPSSAFESIPQRISAVAFGMSATCRVPEAASAVF